MKKIILPIIFLALIYVLPKIAVKTPQKDYPVGSAGRGDSRAAILHAYLESNDSPLATVSSDFVRSADRHKVDVKILVGIANAESSLAKALPEGSNNPFGLGCWTNHPCYRFESYAESVEFLAAALGSDRTYAEFQETREVESIAKIYLTGDKNRWVRNVKYAISEISKIDEGR